MQKNLNSHKVLRDLPPIVGIDPGREGAMVVLQGVSFTHYLMPFKADGKEIDFPVLRETFEQFPFGCHIFLERFLPFAINASAAFSFGRGYGAIEAAASVYQLPVTLVASAQWGKVMHEGISKDLKPKVKSDTAVRRLFPALISQIPKGPRSGKLHDGVVDALLIAGYGRHRLRISK